MKKTTKKTSCGILLFNKDGSCQLAVLPKNTSAQIFLGNFTKTFLQKTCEYLLQFHEVFIMLVYIYQLYIPIQVIKNTAGEPISGDDVKADDICTRILSFVLNRTTEKRGILEKQSQAELKEMTLKERKKYNEELKVVLNGKNLIG